MTAYALVALFLTLFALILGVPRAVNRHRRRPEDGTFHGLLDEFSALDPTWDR